MAGNSSGARSAANYRLYSPKTVRRVRFIKKAQAVGLTLEETKRILDLKAGGRAPCPKLLSFAKNICRRSMRVSHNCGLTGHALRESVNIWRKANAPERECAEEFCDLIEHLSQSEIFKKTVDPLLN